MRARSGSPTSPQSPSRTKKEDVTFFERHGAIRNVRGDVAAGAQGGGKDVALRVRLGVFGAHDAALHQAADIRMIAGETRDGLGTDQVESAIADVGEMKLAADDGESRAGGAHPVELGMFQGKTLNILVRRFKGLRRAWLADRR